VRQSTGLAKGSNLGREALDRGELELPSTETDRALIRSDLGYTELGKAQTYSFKMSTTCASTTRPEPQGNKQHKWRVQVYRKSKTGNKHNMTVSQKARSWQTKAQLIRKGKVVPISDLRPSLLLRLNGACEVRLALMVADGWTRDRQGWWLCSG
jgi:hypothetical protein